MDLVGTVQPLVSLVAPLSGTACAMYRVRLTLIQRLLDGWGDGGSREVAGARFLLRCRLGEVVVDCTRAAIQLAPAHRVHVKVGAAPEQYQRVAELYGRLRRGGLRRNQSVACLEQRLEPGDRVWVTGPLHRVAHSNGLPSGYRLPPSRLLLNARELEALP